MSSSRKLHRVIATFSQESSTKSGDWEELTVEMHFIPGAEGPYWTFKSKQWAIDDPKEITEIIDNMNEIAKKYDTLL
jgi:hypothetical protein